MNGLQTLKTAFWSLAVSLGVLSLLFILCPQVTQPVAALFGFPVPTTPTTEAPPSDVKLVDDSEDEWNFPAVASNQGEPSENIRKSALLQTAQASDEPDEFEQFIASQQEEQTQSRIDRQPEKQITRREIEEITISPAVAPQATPIAQPQINEELNARLASLQAAIDRLAQAEVDRKSAQIERATEKLEYRQQSQRLRELEQQLQSLQAAQLAAANEQKAAEDNSRTTILATQTSTKMEPVDDDGSKRFSLQIRRAGITEVLELLGQATGYNIVISEGVGGTVPSANLRDVTIVEALDSIVESQGLVFEQEGQFIYVMTETEQIDRKSNAATTTAGRDGPAAQ